MPIGLTDWSAFVFEGTVAKVIAPDAANADRFGWSVSHSGDLLAVGAYWSDPGGLSKAGAAYIYHLDANGSATYLDKVTAPDAAAEAEFGASISQSGDVLVVGAPDAAPGGLSQAGAAYIYKVEQNGSVTYIDKVTAPDAAVDDHFGASVSHSGDVLAVGAHYSDPGGVDRAGAVYLYKLEHNGSVTYLDKVTAHDGASGDRFGASVSRSGDLLAVAAHFSDPGGISDAGSAYLYKLEQNGTITYIDKVVAPDAAANDQFGNSVSLSRNVLAVGANRADPGGISDAGSAYLYKLEQNGTITYIDKVVAPDAAVDDSFALSVSMSGDLLAVGSNFSDPGGLSNAGSAYLYRLEHNGTVTFLDKMTAPDGVADDRFGRAVYQSREILAAGAHFSDPGGLGSAGAVYLFSDPSWAPYAPPLTDANFTTAVNLWFANEANATAIYGHISNWNVSRRHRHEKRI